MQEPILYARSVRKNILYGLEEEDGGDPGDAPSADDVEQAARLANAHSFITEWPQKYKTVRLPISHMPLRMVWTERMHMHSPSVWCRRSAVWVLWCCCTKPCGSWLAGLRGEGHDHLWRPTAKVCMQNFVFTSCDTVSCFLYWIGDLRAGSP